MKNALSNFIAEVATKDPKANGLKTGIDLDFSSLVPDSVKSILVSLVDKREWIPTKGIVVASAKPIIPVYKGTLHNGEMVFEFPAQLVINITDMFLVRHVDIKVNRVYLHKALTYLKIEVKTWPDLMIKL